MNAIYKKNFKQTALIWSGCLVAFVLGYILVLNPHLRERRQIEKELTENEQVLDNLSKAAEPQTQAKLKEQLASLRGKFNDFVVESQDSANVTFDISQIAAAKKISLAKIENKKSERSQADDAKLLGVSHIDMSFTGDFNQFAQLLNALERHRPVIFIDKFTISQSRQGNVNNCDVTMACSFLTRNATETISAKL